MIYPSNSLEKLGFEEIRERLKSYCLSTMGVERVSRLKISTDFATIQKWIYQADEFKQVMESVEKLPIGKFFDIEVFAKKLRVEGLYLQEEELVQLRESLKTVFAIVRYFNDKQDLYPCLERLFEGVGIDKILIDSIGNVIDEQGKVRNSASRLLQDLHSEISKAEGEARKKINQIFTNAQNNAWTSDGNLTVRDGRLCIPILAENKRKIRGFVHDESASGQTVYIEPEEVFLLNNIIRELEFERRREIIRILADLSIFLHPYIPQFLIYHQLLCEIDVLRAKALLAMALQAHAPIMVNEPMVWLINARHPLLFLKHPTSIVPLNAKIDGQIRILLVSGPNAGGKSVCMKTIGLLQMMFQAGLLLPVAPESRFGVFKKFFADIGDDQSIDNDLSTYSAHLTKMKYFLTNCDAQSLLLIDEFGSGTDPQFGGPMAEAILEQINQKKAQGVITTHYSNLKQLASATEGLQNASMLFDKELMQPLYVLDIGKPGSSYAFEIAKKIGLQSSIIERAKNKIGIHTQKAENLLVDLEKERKLFYTQKRLLDEQQHNLSVLMQENERLKLFLTENKKAMLAQAKKEAQEILRNSNRLVEQTIAEIKKNHADKEHTQQLRKQLQVEMQKHQSLPTEQMQEETILVGDWVRIRDSENVGQVVSVDKKNVILCIGELKTVIAKNRVQKTSHKEARRTSRSYVSSHAIHVETFSTDVDVRGMRATEALNEIETRFDKALMLGAKHLKIVHGKGDGILRKLVAEYFRKYDHVSHIENEHLDRGGEGITYVYFKD